MIKHTTKSLIPRLIKRPVVDGRPIIINGFMIFTDGTMMQFTDNTVLFFGE